MPPPWRTIVVMPAYNAANTLERTYSDIPKDQVAEIIVVDDLSKDRTVEIAKSLPITLIQHEKNTGTAGTRRPATTPRARTARTTS
jgi:glycosyltransferase involved in cell wall biosynthesis